MTLSNWLQLIAILGNTAVLVFIILIGKMNKKIYKQFSNDIDQLFANQNMLYKLLQKYGIKEKL